jgi:hypothetical protein
MSQYVTKFLVYKSEWKRRLRRSGYIWEEDIKMDFKIILSEYVG